jgi:hypothetical protein
LFDLFILVIMVQFVVCDRHVCYMCEHTTTGCLKYMTPTFLFDVCTTVNVWFVVPCVITSCALQMVLTFLGKYYLLLQSIKTRR